MTTSNALLKYMDTVPLVIGCTGHDDVEASDRASLGDCIGVIFDDLRRQYAHTPLVLLTGLRTVSDRIVAEVAAQRGVRVVGVNAERTEPAPAMSEDKEKAFAALEKLRPLSRDEAMQALRTAPEIAVEDAELDAIVRAAVQSSQERGLNAPFSVPDDMIHLPEDMGSSFPGRANARVGAYIASHSQILLALWDSVPWSETYDWRPGDPAQVVDFRINGVPRSLLPLPDKYSAPLERLGPIYHVVTPRSGQPRPKNSLSFREVFSAPGRFAKWRSRRRWQKTCESMDRLNARPGRKN